MSLKVYFGMLGVIFLVTVLLVKIMGNAEESPRERANRIADGILLGDERIREEVVGDTFVWVACRDGQVIVLVLDSGTERGTIIRLEKLAKCGPALY